MVPTTLVEWLPERILDASQSSEACKKWTNTKAGAFGKKWFSWFSCFMLYFWSGGCTYIFQIYIYIYIDITKYIPYKCLSWFFLILCNLTFSPHMFQCCVFSAPTSMKCPVALLFYSIWWSPTTLQSFRQRVYKHMIPPNPSSSVKQSACPKRSSTQIFQYKIDQFSNWNNKTHHKQRNVFSNQKKSH